MLCEKTRWPTFSGIRCRRRRVGARVITRSTAGARLFSSGVSAEEFLASDYVGRTRCLILDVAMLGMSGLDLQRELTLRREEIPIVFITAHRDETIRPQVLGRGAVECLFTPFSETALLRALHAALGPS